MQIKYYIIAILLAQFFSCLNVKRLKIIDPCIFDRAAMIVYGQDKVDYGCYRSSDISTFSSIWLQNVSYKDGNYMTYENSKIDKNIYFKICNCADTIWAKQQILNEIKNKFPFKIIDTFKHIQVYDINIRDSSNLSPTIYNTSENYAFGVDPCDPTGEKLINWTYPEIIGYTMDHFIDENSLEFLEQGDVKPAYMEHTRYDMKYPPKYFSYTEDTKEQYFKYMKDSMGVDISISKEYLIPVKLIMFDK